MSIVLAAGGNAFARNRAANIQPVRMPDYEPTAEEVDQLFEEDFMKMYVKRKEFYKKDDENNMRHRG